jgi:hypothetical protein
MLFLLALVMAPSPLVGEGFTDVNNKPCRVRGSGKTIGLPPHPAAFGCHLLPPGEKGRTHTGVKNGSGAPSVVLNTTFTFWPIFNLSMSQSTKLVSNEGPSFSVT